MTSESLSSRGNEMEEAGGQFSISRHGKLVRGETVPRGAAGSEFDAMEASMNRDFRNTPRMLRLQPVFGDKTYFGLQASEMSRGLDILVEWFPDDAQRIEQHEYELFQIISNDGQPEHDSPLNQIDVKNVCSVSNASFDLTSCQEARGKVVVDVVLFALDIVHVHIPDSIKDEIATALIQNMNLKTVEKLQPRIETLSTATGDIARATALFKLTYEIWIANGFKTVFQILKSRMRWWQWVKIGAIAIAQLIQSFVNDGKYFIMNAAKCMMNHLIELARKAVIICSEKPFKLKQADDMEPLEPFYIEQAVDEFCKMIPEEHEEVMKHKHEIIDCICNNTTPKNESNLLKIKHKLVAKENLEDIDISNCLMAIAVVAVDAASLVLGLFGLHVSSKSVAKGMAQALGEKAVNGFRQTIENFNTGANTWEKAKTVFTLISETYLAGGYAIIWKAIKENTRWYEWIIICVKCIAQLLVWFASKGVAFVARIVKTIMDAAQLISDALKVNDACGQRPQLYLMN